MPGEGDALGQLAMGPDGTVNVIPVRVPWQGQRAKFLDRAGRAPDGPRASSRRRHVLRRLDQDIPVLGIARVRRRGPLHQLDGPIEPVGRLGPLALESEHLGDLGQARAGIAPVRGDLGVLFDELLADGQAPPEGFQGLVEPPRIAKSGPEVGQGVSPIRPVADVIGEILDQSLLVAVGLLERLPGLVETLLPSRRAPRLLYTRASSSRA